MINEMTPHYITELKTDLINHIDSSINTLVFTINKTVALKEDLLNFATKEDIKNMATKTDLKEVMSLIGTYEVRARKIEEILIEDYKPRIVDLEKVVYSD
jgi:hypothetical protein